MYEAFVDWSEYVVGAYVFESSDSSMDLDCAVTSKLLLAYLTNLIGL